MYLMYPVIYLGLPNVCDDNTNPVQDACRLQKPDGIVRIEQQPTSLITTFALSLIF